jgi:hypothetical protein
VTARTGWYEFVTPGERSTTHIAYVYEDGSIYLPEGYEIVTETDFRLAAATPRFWRLIRGNEVAAAALAVCDRWDAAEVDDDLMGVEICHLRRIVEEVDQ